jgi:peptidoglycan/LPS O-acetylase OafA/YrhL
LSFPGPADNARCDPGRAALAQLVEHIIRNDGVVGSSPPSGTILSPSKSAKVRVLMSAGQLLSSGDGAATLGRRRFWETVSSRKSAGFREDIQALRGWAVLLVLLYHARLLEVPGGYLGVDIFFVISGYLITGLIQREIEERRFDLRRFFARRAKRLLPAAYVTFAVTGLLAPFFVEEGALPGVGAQLLGSVALVSNVVFWRQTGYFDGAAELKPFLHIWSLSLEEQYYMLLPISLLLFPRRWWPWMLSAVALLSLSLCFYLVAEKPQASFFLLPTRAWQLALGSFAAVALRHPRWSARAAILFWPCVAALLLVPLFPLGSEHPKWDALMVSIATMLILVGNQDRQRRPLWMRPLATVGDFSYSLYLVHWPLFAFAANVYLAGTPPGIRWALFGASFLLGYLLYRLVELPVWRAELPPLRKLPLPLAVASALVVVPAVLMLTYPVDRSLAEARDPNQGLGDRCDFTEPFEPRPECATNAQPRILVWGDSFAMHLVDGIVASSRHGVAQATKSRCGPMIGLAPVTTQAGEGTRWARGCIRFNADVLRYLADTPTIDTVVLASRFRNFLVSGEEGDQRRLLSQANGSYREVQSGPGPVASHLDQTIRAIRGLGRKVVIVGPPPADPHLDTARCHDRERSKLVAWSMRGQGCFLVLKRAEREHAPVRILLDAVRRRSNVDVLDLHLLLCRKGRCATQIDGQPLYRDIYHLSRQGSRKLGTAAGLGKLVRESAS